MKNIHILPTDKPSRLVLDDTTQQLILINKGEALWGNRNIYITNDSEIKEGDWFYLYDADIIAKYVNVKPVKEGKKIILTTDQDLIKDGVQAIDDEFLEWFVKNPSCEEVEIELFPKFSNKLYGIIIPKEEPKQIYYNTVGIENGVNVVKGQFNTQKEALDLANELNRKFPDLYYDWRETLIKEKPKQETLEEAAEKYIAKDNNNRYYNDFIAGAKWQSERMYSEEDMIEFGFSTYCYISELMGVPFNLMSENRLNAEEWFEQFKKK